MNPSLHLNALSSAANDAYFNGGVNGNGMVHANGGNGIYSNGGLGPGGRLSHGGSVDHRVVSNGSQGHGQGQDFNSAYGRMVHPTQRIPSGGTSGRSSLGPISRPPLVQKGFIQNDGYNLPPYGTASLRAHLPPSGPSGIQTSFHSAPSSHYGSPHPQSSVSSPGRYPDSGIGVGPSSSSIHTSLTPIIGGYIPGSMSPAAMAAAAANKNKYTRSRTGCLACRTKRVKCDEGRPVCRRCITAKREVSVSFLRSVVKRSRVGFAVNTAC